MDWMMRAHSSRMAPFSFELAPQVLEESDGRESEIVDLMKEVAALDPYHPPDRTEPIDRAARAAASPSPLRRGRGYSRGRWAAGTKRPAFRSGLRFNGCRHGAARPGAAAPTCLRLRVGCHCSWLRAAVGWVLWPASGQRHSAQSEQSANNYGHLGYLFAGQLRRLPAPRLTPR